VNGPEEFKLIVQHHAARSGKKARRGGARGQEYKEEHAVNAERVHHTGRRSRTDRYAAAIAKSQRPSSPSLGLRQGTSGKGKARSGSNGGTSTAPIDVDGLEDTHMPVGQVNGWPEATRARFERKLPVFVSPTFGGKPPVRIAHAVVVELYLCPIKDVDAEMAGVAVKGACDSQVRGFMLTSGTLSSAQVSEWLCSAMSAALRPATLPGMAYAVQRVVDNAVAEAAALSGVIVAAAAAPNAAAARSASFPGPHGAAVRASIARGEMAASVAPTSAATTTPGSALTVSAAAAREAPRTAVAAAAPAVAAAAATAVASEAAAATAAAGGAALAADPAPVTGLGPRAAVALAPRAGGAVAPVPRRAPVPRTSVTVPERRAFLAPRASADPAASHVASSAAAEQLDSVFNVARGGPPVALASMAAAAPAAARLTAGGAATDAGV